MMGYNKRDTLRAKLIEKIILLFETELITKKNTRKVALLKKISSCIRQELETSAQ